MVPPSPWKIDKKSGGTFGIRTLPGAKQRISFQFLGTDIYSGCALGSNKHLFDSTEQRATFSRIRPLRYSLPDPAPIDLSTKLKDCNRYIECFKMHTLYMVDSPGQKGC